MEISFFQKLTLTLKKHVLLCFVGVFILGGAIVYIFLQNKESGYVVEVSAQGNDENAVIKGNSSEDSIFVDISGAVNKPGFYEINGEARVGDAVLLSGGINNEASAVWVSKNLNLSAKLKDSSKIYIPFEWEFYLPEIYTISKTVNGDYASSGNNSGNSESENNSNGQNDSNQNGGDSGISDGGSGDTSNPGGVEDGKVNVNTATSSELDTLPGIGPAYAEKIISNRPYENIEDLSEKSGLYKSTIENIKELIIF